MDEPKLSAGVCLLNYAGLHARAATVLAKKAREFDATVELVRDGLRVDCREVLQVLTLGAAQNDELGLEVSGPQAQEAFDAVKALFDDGFGEDREPPA